MNNADAYRIAASMTGEIIFNYDISTHKLMMYSDKAEISKYGSWIYGFKNTFTSQSKIHEEDQEIFDEFAEFVEDGASAYYENSFRMALGNSGDFKPYHVVARTIYDGNKQPEAVVGKFIDVDKMKELLLINVSDNKRKSTDLVDESAFISRLYAHKPVSDDTELAVICFKVEDIDSITEKLGKEGTKSFFKDIVRRVRRSFMYKVSVGQLADSTFGIFVRNIGDISVLLDAFENFRSSIYGLCYSNGVSTRTDYGICTMKEKDFYKLPVAIYQKAAEALSVAAKRSQASVVFAKEDMKDYSEDEEREREEKAFLDELLESSCSQFAAGKGFVRVLKDTFAKAGAYIHADRISFNLRNDGVYDEYLVWESESTSDIRNGNLLHITGDAGVYEKKITTKGYIRNDVYDYPDDSEYGRKLLSSSVKSVAQIMYEHENADGSISVGILSAENYKETHYWSKSEIRTIVTLLEIIRRGVDSPKL